MNHLKNSDWIVWTLLVALGIMLGLGVYTFYYGEGLSYFSSDPKACTNCHIMQPQFDSWQKASHHTVAKCVDCHLPHTPVKKLIAKAENGFWHSKGFTFQDFHEPIFIRESNMKILQNNCVDCHESFVHDILFEETVNPSEMNCIHCHRGVGHGPTTGIGKYEPVEPENVNQEGYHYEPK